MAKWLKSQELVAFAVRERVARITLNRPEKRNALSTELLSQLLAAFMEADDRNDVNVVLLEGAGKDFCAGYDLPATYVRRDAEVAGLAEKAPEYRGISESIDDVTWNIERMQQHTLAAMKLHKPVIAKLQGNCLAGGTDVALSCDLVIAAEDARIGFPATRANGTPPSHMWLYHCGPQWTRRLLMTGDCINGADAARIGLVLDAVPAAELDAAADELARRVALMDPEIVANIKRVVNHGLDLMGASMLQRLAAEGDARANLTNGPRRAQFKKDMAEQGLKTALKNRDAPFGDGNVRLRAGR
jgi:enoyl-CoA hydratase